MVCIATETQKNKKIIITDNGVLCQDNPEDFSNALAVMARDFTKWDANVIRKTLSHYNWANISENLKKYILKYEQKGRIEKNAIIKSK